MLRNCNSVEGVFADHPVAQAALFQVAGHSGLDSVLGRGPGVLFHLISEVHLALCKLVHFLIVRFI